MFYYGGRRAPSFIDVAGEDDRILYVNSFSKNWAMTGWRVGWLKVPPSLQQVFENLIQYSTSGVAQFMQRGAVAALDEGDAFIDEQVARARQARDLVCGILGRTGRARFAVPQGAFYLFFSVDGIADSRQAAFDIVDHANVGLAPGTAFGEGWDAFFRLCFHRRLDQVEEAAERLAVGSGLRESGRQRRTSAPAAGDAVAGGDRRMAAVPNGMPRAPQVRPART